jgi:hypothetical protein
VSAAAAPAKPLKSRNLLWLCSLVILDALVIFAIVLPAGLATASLTAVVAARVAMTPLLPLVVLLLSQVLPSSLKASFVFWRVKDALPGHRAFSKYAVADPRVNVPALQKRLGQLPSSPRDQNATWFKLYLQAANEPSVVDANKGYLMFRDMAAISILLVVAVPVSLFANGASLRVTLIVAVLLAVQYLFTAIAARNNGVALVTNVLSLSADGGKQKKR